MILILGAPRTGTTLLYQLIVNLWKVNYFANDGTIHNTDAGEVPLVSNYGKTTEPHEPSEASYIFAKWFGEERAVKPEYKQEMIDTLTIHRPMVIKNIWNVYRVNEWLEYFPDTQFIWMRRDEFDAARSDENAPKKHPSGLNCAFRKYGGAHESLNTSPDRFVAQQAMINDTIWRSRDVHKQIMYEELCADTKRVVDLLRDYLSADWRGRPIPKLERR